MIKTENLQKVFRTDEVETWALNNVSIEVKKGEFVAIMGPSGCGKSTLLNILGLLDNPTNGTYYLDGIEVSKYTESQRTNLRKGVIGFVFQSLFLPTNGNAVSKKRWTGWRSVTVRSISRSSCPVVSSNVWRLPVPLSGIRS